MLEYIVVEQLGSLVEIVYTTVTMLHLQFEVCPIALITRCVL